MYLQQTVHKFHQVLSRTGLAIIPRNHDERKCYTVGRPLGHTILRFVFQPLCMIMIQVECVFHMYHSDPLCVSVCAKVVGMAVHRDLALKLFISIQCPETLSAPLGGSVSVCTRLCQQRFVSGYWSVQTTFNNGVQCWSGGERGLPASTREPLSALYANNTAQYWTSDTPDQTPLH